MHGYQFAVEGRDKDIHDCSSLLGQGLKSPDDSLILGIDVHAFEPCFRFNGEASSTSKCEEYESQKENEKKR